MIGEDEEGGVFVSENFYYDSEIYRHQTLRVHRPAAVPAGGLGVAEIVGREFKNARIRCNRVPLKSM